MEKSHFTLLTIVIMKLGGQLVVSRTYTNDQDSMVVRVTFSVGEQNYGIQEHMSRMMIDHMVIPQHALDCFAASTIRKFCELSGEFKTAFEAVDR